MKKTIYSTLIFSLFVTITCKNQEKSTESQNSLEASYFVKEYNKNIQENLPKDTRDFDRATKGYLGSIQESAILDSLGKMVFDIAKSNFIEKNQEPPSSVNPILWRQSKLNSIHGLFKVTDGIYQVRGYDMANMTLVEGETGWIIIDPLTSEETSHASMQLVDKILGKKPIKAVILTHSHIDHFGGIWGLFKNKNTQNIPIIAPNHFFHEAISENVMAGYHMGRRGQFMFGSSLKHNPFGTVGAGLNQSGSFGKTGVINPTVEIKEDNQKTRIDGVEFVFQLTPGAEAPAEFMFYIPKYKAFCHAEEMNQGMHNLYTLRGAKIRDGLLWSKHLNEALERFGEKVEVSFGSHHWPVWGIDEVKKFYENQRDLYKYIHDQTLNYANKGYGPLEIAEKLKLPKSLDTLYYNKGIYGSLSHNIKAQYQLYFGWFDGHPSNLHKLPLKKEGEKMIEYMGGEKNVLEKAKKDYEKGEYRFVASVLAYLVEVNPKNTEAKKLLAMAYKQMGYMAESGPWRNFYLTGAKELEEGMLPYYGVKGRNKELVFQLPYEKIFDAMSIALNGEKAWGKELTINFNFTNPNGKNLVIIKNSVLNYSLNKNNSNADFTITMSKETFAKIALDETSYAKEIALGNIKVKGSVFKLLEYSKLIDKLNFNFPLVLPVEE